MGTIQYWQQASMRVQIILEMYRGRDMSIWFEGPSLCWMLSFYDSVTREWARRHTLVRDVVLLLEEALPAIEEKDPARYSEGADFLQYLKHALAENEKLHGPLG